MFNFVVVPVVRAFLSPFQGPDHATSVHILSHERKNLQYKVDIPKSMEIRQNVLSNQTKIPGSSAQFPVQFRRLFQVACRIDENFDQFAHRKIAYSHNPTPDSNSCRNCTKYMAWCFPHNSIDSALLPENCVKSDLSVKNQLQPAVGTDHHKVEAILQQVFALDLVEL